MVRHNPSAALHLLTYLSGPCQFPTLGFVVARYKDVQTFRPETFWFIYLTLSQSSSSQGEAGETRFTWRRGHLFEYDAATVIYEMMITSGSLARVAKVTKKETKKWYLIKPAS